ncbi:Mss4-like protein [Xylariaceae sp. FL0594]|nr:Mss4-like protein [Xylariaceae sp. FL0594]
MASTADKTKAYIPHNSLRQDGWSKDDEATATCFCGSVQLVLPTASPGLVDVFVCNCSDCRKITASMFASNIIARDTHVRFVRGQDNLAQFAQRQTIGSGGLMTNHFCRTCGTLMYRVGEKFPGVKILRLGTVDDFVLAETKLRPRTEQYIEDRVAWFTGCEGASQKKGMAYL